MLTSSTKHPTRQQWRILDLVSLIFFGTIFLFFILILTPFGDSMAANGSQSLMTSATGGATRRHHMISLIESGRNVSVEICDSEVVGVDYMPCEDPSRNRLLSREMNFYRERHCPRLDEKMLCLVPMPVGYNVPITGLIACVSVLVGMLMTQCDCAMLP
ncbi:probable methyltransferase PMT13 [Tanacetum coccineum]